MDFNWLNLKGYTREGFFFFLNIWIHKLNLRSYWTLHGECEVRWVNPTSGQWYASSDVGKKNPTSQQPGSNSSVRKLILLIYKGGVNWWDKNTTIERLPWLLTQATRPNCITLHASKQGACSAEVVWKIS